MLGFIWKFIWALFSPCGVSVCWFVAWCLCRVKSVDYESEQKLNQYWEYVVLYAASTEKTEGGKKRLRTRFQIMLWNSKKNTKTCDDLSNHSMYGKASMYVLGPWDSGLFAWSDLGFEFHFAVSHTEISDPVELGSIRVMIQTTRGDQRNKSLKDWNLKWLSSQYFSFECTDSGSDRSRGDSTVADECASIANHQLRSYTV